MLRPSLHATVVGPDWLSICNGRNGHTPGREEGTPGHGERSDARGEIHPGPGLVAVMPGGGTTPHRARATAYLLSGRGKPSFLGFELCALGRSRSRRRGLSRSSLSPRKWWATAGALHRHRWTAFCIPRSEYGLVEDNSTTRGCRGDTDRGSFRALNDTALVLPLLFGEHHGATGGCLGAKDRPQRALCVPVHRLNLLDARTALLELCGQLVCVTHASLQRAYAHERHMLFSRDNYTHCDRVPRAHGRPVRAPRA